MAVLTTAALVGIPAAMALTDVLSQYWQRETQREQIEAGKKSEEAKTKAISRLLKESKTSKRRDIERLLKERSKTREAAREAEMMRMFTESQNQRMAMILSAMQGVNRPAFQPQGGGGGMLNILRSNY